MRQFLASTVSLLLTTLMQVATVEAGLTWSQPEVVSFGAYRDSPNLSMNQSDQAMAIWVSENGSSQQVVSAFYSNGWQPLLNVSAPGNPYVYHPSVVLNNSAHALALWHRYELDTSLLQVAKYSDGTWSTPQSLLTLPHGTSSLTDFQIALNNAEQGVAVWTVWSKSNAGDHISASFYDQGNWQTGAITSFSASEGQHIRTSKLAFNDAGDTVLVWRESGASQFVIKAVYRQRGSSTWSQPQTLAVSPVDGIGMSNQPQVAINSSGDVIAVWSAGLNGGGLEMATYSQGQWSEPSLVATGFIESQSSVALNNKGNALIVWQDGNALYALRPQKGVWVPSVRISPTGWSCQNSKMVFNDLDEAIVIYTASEELINPPPFPPIPKTFGFVTALCQDVWASPTLVFDTVLDVALNNQGQAFVLGASSGTLQVKRGSF